MSDKVEVMVHPQRASLAAELYNRTYTDLIEAGWTEAADETTPGWWWRHPDHVGTFAMDAAYIVVAQAKPKRG